MQSPERELQPDPMLGRMPEVLGYLIHVDSLLAIGVLAILISVLEWVGALPEPGSDAAFVVARLVWTIYFFLVAHKAALGKLRLPVPSDFRDTRDTLIKPLLRLTLGFSWFIGPVLAAAHLSVGLDPFLTRYMARPLAFLVDRGWWGYLLLLWGLLYVPPAVIAALVWRRVLRTIDPSLGFRIACAVPRAYAVTFALLAGLMVAGVLLKTIGVGITAALPIPLAAPVIRHLLRLWVPLAQARLIGGFVYRNKPFLEVAAAPAGE